MRRIDYNTEQYQDYAHGRALSEPQLRTWIDAFAAMLPGQRPLAGLDVGSGTGRFTPALARAFGPGHRDVHGGRLARRRLRLGDRTVLWNPR
jgi:ubiquinone/menaquinone biosynthesis C-methylase UbiE